MTFSTLMQHTASNQSKTLDIWLMNIKVFLFWGGTDVHLQVCPDYWNFNLGSSPSLKTLQFNQAFLQYTNYTDMAPNFSNCWRDPQIEDSGKHATISIKLVFDSKNLTWTSYLSSATMWIGDWVTIVYDSAQLTLIASTIISADGASFIKHSNINQSLWLFIIYLKG